MGLFALFKGDHGSGKTVGAISFPDPVVVLDHDFKGIAIARKHFPGKDVSYMQFDNVLQVGDQIENWLNHGCPFETVIGDSITSLSNQCLSSLDELKGTNILKKLKELKDLPPDKKRSPELRGFDYYNAEDSFLKWYLDHLKMLHARTGKNVIMTAHILVSEQSNMVTNKVVETRRIVTAGSKIAAYIPAQFDDAWHFGVGYGKAGGDIFSHREVQHVACTEAIGEDFAKTAYRLPQTIDFTNGSLYDQIKNQLGVETRSTEPKPETKKSNILNF